MTGLGVATACLIFLPGLLVLLAWIDFKRRTIPNALNATIALIGAFRAAALGGLPAIVETILQAMIVAAAVWLLRWLYFVIRRQQGLGLGDVKLLTASTFWVGMVGIPLQLLSASLSALAVVATLHAAGYSVTRKSAVPFGPFLAFGLLVTLAAQESRWLV